MQYLLEAINVNKQFGDHHVLKDVSIRIPRGTIFGLLGPNGAGKTTLIRILTRITAPDSGQILYDGELFSENRSIQIGYLPEERGLYRKMKVWDQAMYLTQIKGIPKHEAEHSLNDWFQRFDMLGWKRKAVEDLSKGMQQKLQILDEPFSGFDPVNAEEIKQEILRLRDAGKTIVFSTHNMSSVEELCDHIALIHRGENILQGSVNEVRDSFSQNLFEVTFVGSKVAFANALGHAFEIDSIEEKASVSHAVVRSFSDEGGRLLIKAVADYVDVVSFAKRIPSMHDIFIAQVSHPVTQEVLN